MTSRTRIDIALLARYNQWMNEKVYGAAATLTPEALHLDRRAFFGSIFGTLNHIAVGDTLWLQRFGQHPAHFASLEAVRGLPTPTALNQPLSDTLEGLSARHRQLDQAFIDLAAELRDEHLDGTLVYTTTQGVRGEKDALGVLMHVFNHQTHHRGQVTTLLSQLGIDVGATDLLLLL